MKKYLLLVLVVITLFACEKYDEEILPIIGTYEGVILGLAGPFVMSVAADYGDDIFIEAPFDGDYWSIVEADIDDKDRDRKIIDIDYQEIEPGIYIWGEGVFYGYSLQLDYILNFYGEEYGFSLVATKL